MSTSFVDEYLIKLGAVVDQSGMQRFNQALQAATSVADASAASIAGAFFKAQTEIVGGFVAIGSAALGIVDKVAMADQSYRLFALHMYMSKDAARSLKVAMDALGASLGDMTWDKELRDRAHQLILDQQAMAPDGDFDAQMKKVRDIRFEFTRMEVEGEYLAMHVVNDFMKALGLGPDALLEKLQQFNNWVTHNLPMISQKIVTLFMPVWKDMKDVLVATGQAAAATGLAFTNIIGALSGDSSIEGATFDFEKFAGAIQHVAHWMAIFAEIIAKVEELVADLAAGLGYVFSHIPAPILDAALGGGAGFAVGGPVGAAVGAGGGLLLGLTGGHNAVGPGASTSGNASAQELVAKYAAQFGVDKNLAMALVQQESGFNQGATSSTGARGIMQLTKGTAAALGANREDAEDNVKGGMRLLATLLANPKYNTATAIAAYHDGETRVNAALAGKATISSEGQDEVARVMRAMGTKGDVHVGPTTIHITQQPGESNKDLAQRIVDTQNKRVQRNLTEFQDTAWSY